MKKRSIFSILLPSIIKDFTFVYRFAIFGILFAGILLIFVSINQKKEDVEREISGTTSQIKKVFSYDIDYVKYQIFYVSSQISEIKGDKNNNIAIEKLLSTFVTRINGQVDVALTWNAFSWIDKNNKLTIDGTSGILARPIDMTGRDYLKETPYKFNKISFGKPIFGALSQQYIIPAATGVFEKNGNYIGTIVFGFHIDKLTAKLSKYITNNAISFAIFENGEYIFSSDNFDISNLEEITASLKKYNENYDHDKSVISSQRAFSKKGLNAYMERFKNYPFEIVAIYDQDAYFKEIIDIAIKQISIIFIIIFSCVILFRNIYKTVVRPVSKLSKFAEKISQRDFSYEINAPETKELQDLHSALELLKQSFSREENLISQLKLANQKIAQENFNKSEFLSAISHDIRNPLSAIISFAQMAKSRQDQSEEDSIKEIENCAHEVMQFINDLMDVTQISSGIFSINMSQKINIYEMIQRSIRVNRDFARRKRIELISNIDQDIKPINLDQRRIKQILINLISNAIKYSRQNTKVEIIAKTIDEGQKLQIKVIDEGIGMSQEQLDKAMEKFGLANEEEKKDRLDSFGLGLNIVRQLVELQGGVIEIVSKKGKGTTVTVTFSYQQNEENI